MPRPDAIAKNGASWLEGLTDRQKVLAKLSALKADNTQILDELANVMGCYSRIEKPCCFLALEPLLPPPAFWQAFHQHWRSFKDVPHGRYLWVLGRRRLDWRVDYMPPLSAAAFAALPETLSIWRESCAETIVALSWKFTDSVEESPSRDHRRLVGAKAPKSAVAGFYVGEENREAEVVLFSTKAVCRSR